MAQISFHFMQRICRWKWAVSVCIWELHFSICFSIRRTVYFEFEHSNQRLFEGNYPETFKYPSLEWIKYLSSFVIYWLPTAGVKKGERGNKGWMGRPSAIGPDCAFWADVLQLQSDPSKQPMPRRSKRKREWVIKSVCVRSCVLMDGVVVNEFPSPLTPTCSEV